MSENGNNPKKNRAPARQDDARNVKREDPARVSGEVSAPKTRHNPDVAKTVIFEDLFSQENTGNIPQVQHEASNAPRKVIRTEITGSINIAKKAPPEPQAEKQLKAEKQNPQSKPAPIDKPKDKPQKPSKQPDNPELEEKTKIVEKVKPEKTKKPSKSKASEDTFENTKLFGDAVEEAEQLQFQTNPIKINIPQDTFGDLKKIKAPPAKKLVEPEEIVKQQEESPEPPAAEEFEDISSFTGEIDGGLPEEPAEDFDEYDEQYDEEYDEDFDDDFDDEFNEDYDEPEEEFEEAPEQAYPEDTRKSIPQKKSAPKSKLDDWSYPLPPDRVLTINSVTSIPRPSKFARAVFDWIGEFFVAGVLVVLVFTFVFRVTTVNGYSMLPNFDDGYRVLSTDFHGELERGDVVIITNVPEGPIIKRVIATEGQTVDLDPVNKAVIVDGMSVDNSEFGISNGITEAGYTDRVVLDFPQVVPKGCIFVLGDNRTASLDSRYEEVGMIDERNVLGKVVFNIYPFDKFGATD